MFSAVFLKVSSETVKQRKCYTSFKRRTTYHQRSQLRGLQRLTSRMQLEELRDMYWGTLQLRPLKVNIQILKLILKHVQSK